MLRRLARWLLRDEINKGHAEWWLKGHHEGLGAGRIAAMDSTVDMVRSLLQSGHMCFLPFKQENHPVSFVRPKEPFHLLAAEVQMSDAPVLAEPVNRALLENEPEYCERLGMSPEAIQATIDPVRWARASRAARRQARWRPRSRPRRGPGLAPSNSSSRSWPGCLMPR